jgi:hypothetical protein
MADTDDMHVRVPSDSAFGVPVGQLALVVPDVEASIRAYWTLLGIGPWRVYTVGGPHLRGVLYRGEPASFKIRYGLAMSGSLTMEVIQPLEGPSIWHEFLEGRGASLHHMAFYVPDFERAASRMQGHGWVAVQTGDGFGRTRDGRFAYYEHGDDVGCLVEIVQAPTERDAPELVYPGRLSDQRQGPG